MLNHQYKIFLAAVLLAVLYGISADALEMNTNRPAIIAAQSMQQGKNGDGKIPAIDENPVLGFDSIISAPGYTNMSIAEANEISDGDTGSTPWKDGEKTRWGVTPSLGKFSFNPITVIRNMEVMLQYSF